MSDEKAYKVRAIHCSHKASQEEIYERLKTITGPLTHAHGKRSKKPGRSVSR